MNVGGLSTPASASFILTPNYQAKLLGWFTNVLLSSLQKFRPLDYPGSKLKSPSVGTQETSIIVLYSNELL